jgi:predicted transglutaminase-like cysteine proteinase
MSLGRAVLAPIAAVRFCMDYAAECAKSERTEVELTAERWAELEQTNAKINLAILPKPHPDIDKWSLGVAEGNCSEYAVRKRHELITAGWPAGAVTLAVAKIDTGEFHLVVLVATDRGDYVLDNLHETVIPWRRAGYEWVMRSDAADPRLWQAVDEPSAVKSAGNLALAWAALPQEGAARPAAAALLLAEIRPAAIPLPVPRPSFQQAEASGEGNGRPAARCAAKPSSIRGLAGGGRRSRCDRTAPTAG